MYHIRQANFSHFISLSKFAATNSVVKIQQKIQRSTSGNRRNSSRAPMHDLQLLSVAHQQVSQAAVNEGHMWIKSFIYKKRFSEMEQALSRSLDYRGQYKHVEKLIVCLIQHLRCFP